MNQEKFDNVAYKENVKMKFNNQKENVKLVKKYKNNLRNIYQLTNIS